MMQKTTTSAATTRTGLTNKLLVLRSASSSASASASASTSASLATSTTARARAVRPIRAVTTVPRSASSSLSTNHSTVLVEATETEEDNAGSRSTIIVSCKSGSRSAVNDTTRITDYSYINAVSRCSSRLRYNYKNSSYYSTSSIPHGRSTTSNSTSTPRHRRSGTAAPRRPTIKSKLFAMPTFPFEMNTKNNLKSDTKHTSDNNIHSNKETKKEVDEHPNHTISKEEEHKLSSIPSSASSTTIICSDDVVVNVDQTTLAALQEEEEDDNKSNSSAVASTSITSSSTTPTTSSTIGAVGSTTTNSSYVPPPVTWLYRQCLKTVHKNLPSNEHHLYIEYIKETFRQIPTTRTTETTLFTASASFSFLPLSLSSTVTERVSFGYSSLLRWLHQREEKGKLKWSPPLPPPPPPPLIPQLVQDDEDESSSKQPKKGGKQRRRSSSPKQPQRISVTKTSNDVKEDEGTRTTKPKNITTRRRRRRGRRGRSKVETRTANKEHRINKGKEDKADDDDDEQQQKSISSSSSSSTSSSTSKNNTKPQSKTDTKRRSTTTKQTTMKKKVASDTTTYSSSSSNLPNNSNKEKSQTKNYQKHFLVDDSSQQDDDDDQNMSHVTEPMSETHYYETSASGFDGTGWVAMGGEDGGEDLEAYDDDLDYDEYGEYLDHQSDNNKKEEEDDQSEHNDSTATDNNNDKEVEDTRMSASSSTKTDNNNSDQLVVVEKFLKDLCPHFASSDIKDYATKLVEDGFDSIHLLENELQLYVTDPNRCDVGHIMTKKAHRRSFMKAYFDKYGDHTSKE